MAYYLGQNNTGDLAGVLTGAYSASVPKTAQQSLNPLNSPTAQPNAPGGGDGSGGGTTRETRCHQECDPQYGPGTPENQRCVEICLARTDNCTNNPSLCKSGETCQNGVCVPTVTKPCNPPCVAPKVCVDGACVDSTTPGTCADGKGKPYAANPTACPCGTGWSTLTGKCGTGYTFIKRDNPADWKSEFPYIEGAIGTCQCTQAISDWKEKKGGTLGEYQYPPEMQALMDLLLNRGKELMGMPLGYSQDAQDKMFGRGFENVRGTEAGTRAGLEQGLSRSGMLGTGAGQGMLNDLSWQTEGNVANLARDLFVGNEVKKKQDLLDYSTAAQSMLGSGMGFEQLLEAVNASRRGEGSAALQSLLAWLLSQK